MASSAPKKIGHVFWGPKLATPTAHGWKKFLPWKSAPKGCRVLPHIHPTSIWSNRLQETLAFRHIRPKRDPEIDTKTLRFQWWRSTNQRLGAEKTMLSENVWPQNHTKSNQILSNSELVTFSKCWQTINAARRVPPFEDFEKNTVESTAPGTRETDNALVIFKNENQPPMLHI